MCDGYVGADTGIGLLASGHDPNGSPNSSTIVHGFNDHGSLSGSVNGNLVGVGGVPASLGMVMDVDDGLESVNFTGGVPLLW